MENQIREEEWARRIANGEKRYARLDLGTRKSGMLGGRGGRAYRAR